MPFRLVERRTIWLPTRAGWVFLGFLFIAPFVTWWFRAEAFFAVTDRAPADVLVVEGWISGRGIAAALSEYRQGGYKWLVTTGGMTGERWDERRWNFAIEAEEQLLKLGAPRERLLAAPSDDVETHRTYAMALSAREVLARAGIHPMGINVFTKGAHARRSRLVFAKAFSDVPVGSIAWMPPYSSRDRWWHSSERAEELIKETVGYPFEWLFSSGRGRL